MKGKTIAKASGGGIDVVSGNPNVIKEARQRKKGGRVYKEFKAGGKVVGFMTGGAVRPRLDKPGRKMGGKVGGDFGTSEHGREKLRLLLRGFAPRER